MTEYSESSLQGIDLSAECSKKIIFDEINKLEPADLRRIKQYTKDRLKMFSTEGICDVLSKKFPEYKHIIEDIDHIRCYSNDFKTVIQPMIVLTLENPDTGGESTYQLHYRFCPDSQQYYQGGLVKVHLECYMTGSLMYTPENYDELITFGEAVYDTILHIGY
jgi:hypothetical protein